MKVALVYCPIWHSVMPPVSLAYLKGNIRDHEVVCLDLNMDFLKDWNTRRGNSGGKKEIPENQFYLLNPMAQESEANILIAAARERFISEHRGLMEKWLSAMADCDVLGLSVTYWNYVVSDIIGSEFKKRYPDRFVICGGPACTFDNGRYARQMLGRYADVAVQGPAEFIITDLLASLADGVRGRMISAAETLAGFTIDRLRPPLFDDFTFSDYDFPKLLPVYSAVGCIAKCVFCRERELHPGPRLRSVGGFLAELDFLRSRYGANAFFISQPIFNLERENLKGILRGVTERKMRISFQARIMPNLDDDEVMEMARACADWIVIGLESASPAVRGEMGKFVDQEQTMRIIRKAAKYELPTSYNIIIGYPTETEADYQMTFDFIKEYVGYRGNRGLMVNTYFLCPEHALDRYSIKFDRNGYWYSPIVDIETRYRRFAQVRDFLTSLPPDPDTPMGFRFPEQVRLENVWRDLPTMAGIYLDMKMHDAKNAFRRGKIIGG